MTKEVDGQVVLAEVADLNVDGSPEICVYVQSAGSGSHGSLVAYSANRKESLGEIDLPPITDDPKASKGYMDHDEFRIQYKLVAGEAGWRLRADKVVEY